jgi:hypothetical protein
LSASRSGHFTPRESTAAIHCIGGWVDPRNSLNAVAKRKCSCLCRESNTGSPARRLAATLTELSLLIYIIGLSLTLHFFFGIPLPVYVIVRNKRIFLEGIYRFRNFVVLRTVQSLNWTSVNLNALGAGWFFLASFRLFLKRYLANC